MSSRIKNILYVVGCCIIPILITLPFMLIFKRAELVESSLLLIAVIELIAWNTRRGKRERQNMKNYGRYKTKKEDNGYDKYKEMQNLLLCSSILNITISLLWFMIFHQWWITWM